MMLPVDVFMRYVDKEKRVSLFAHRVIGDETDRFVRGKEAQAAKDGGSAMQITESRFKQERNEK